MISFNRYFADNRTASGIQKHYQNKNKPGLGIDGHQRVSHQLMRDLLN